MQHIKLYQLSYTTDGRKVTYEQKHFGKQKKVSVVVTFRDSQTVQNTCYKAKLLLKQILLEQAQIQRGLTKRQS